MPIITKNILFFSIKNILFVYKKSINKKQLSRIKTVEIIGGNKYEERIL